MAIYLPTFRRILMSSSLSGSSRRALLCPEDGGTTTISVGHLYPCRSQWPRGLRRGSAAASLLGLRVRIPPGAWMSVFCECCVLWSRGLCDGLITRPEESYRVWCVWVRSWKLEKWGCLGPQGADEPLEKKYICLTYTGSTGKRVGKFSVGSWHKIIWKLCSVSWGNTWVPANGLHFVLTCSMWRRYKHNECQLVARLRNDCVKNSTNIQTWAINRM
jgi:hypothetical protein